MRAAARTADGTRRNLGLCAADAVRALGGFDLLSIAPIAIRRGEWLPRIVDRLDRLGIKRQHWQPAGAKRPVDP